jgi:PAS domain S-box-containing protein
MTEAQEKSKNILNVDDTCRASMEIKVAERTSELANALESLERENEAQIESVLALVASEEKFKAIFNGAGDGILVLDPESGKILIGNTAFCQMLGYRDGELSYLVIQDLHTEEDLPYVMEQFSKHQNSKITISKNIPVKRKNGTVFYADINSTHITIAGRHYFTGFFRDISEQKVMEKALLQSEEKLRIITAAAFDAIIMLNEDGNVTFWNGAAEKMFGYTEEEISGRDMHTILAPPAFREAHCKAFSHFKQTGQGAALDRTVELAGLRKNGDEFPLELSLSAMQVKGVWYSVGIVRDISKRKLAERNMLDSAEKYRVMVEAIDASIYICSNEYRIEFMNDRLIKRTGRDATGEYCYKALHNLESICEWCVNERVFKGETVNWEIQSPKDDRWYEINNSPIHRANGAISKQAIITDVTERKTAEEAIITMNRDLELRVMDRTRQLNESNKELESFAYVVSHDLKAPLRAITSLSNWLAEDYKDKLDEEGQETLNLIVQRSKRMDGLINGILNYSRVGRSTEEAKLVELATVVHDAISLVSPPENIAVTVETELPAIVCDQTRIYEVFQNLLSNAVKYMDKPKGEIKVGCVDDGQLYTFYVSDNGPGIEEAYFDKIFQMFQTLHSRDEVESTGVGLTIVKKIVEMYGGMIWLESKIGAGSTFRFTLPYMASEETETAEDGGG